MVIDGCQCRAINERLRQMEARDGIRVVTHCPVCVDAIIDAKNALVRENYALLAEIARLRELPSKRAEGTA